MVTVVLEDHVARAVAAAVAGAQMAAMVHADQLAQELKGARDPDVASAASEEIDWLSGKAEMYGEAQAAFHAAIREQAAPADLDLG